MLLNTLTLLMLASLAQCVCHNTSTLVGHTSALCTDDETGFFFEYVDLDDRYPQTESVDTSELLEAIYAGYRKSSGFRMTRRQTPSASRSSNTFKRTPIDKRAPNTLTRRFSRCSGDYRYEGACADDHVINWQKPLSLYQDQLVRLMQATKGRRMQRDPRVVTYAPHSNAPIILQWAVNSFGDFTSTQAYAMTQDITYTCQQNSFSAETKFDNGRSPIPQYFCVSDRDTGCVVNRALDECNSIPDPPPTTK